MEYHRNIMRKFTVSYVHAHSFSLYTKHNNPYTLNFFNKYYNINNEEKKLHLLLILIYITQNLVK